ncbi:MarR family transcriptional regulator [Burkholderiaceae bacterium FT117]|uniref:MarR family winged helix-turn-helix transcriptional regulator n=1 Tax=Zeimonas sediminis TaxID=2944268 RepID=UPI002343158F|nr:MarR family transcriptional regulator [Zeimonas sediminis]MCM5571835.1 MarR family transcriptional regulator [Zeimonas sediminis]
MSRKLPKGEAALPLVLQDFLPYRLAVLAEAVSRSIAQVYTARFDLSRDEWRVLAALAETGTMKTRDAALYATLDKMQVSRAVAGLERAGLIDREEDAGDRRNRILTLTPAGRALLRRLTPMVQAREDFLLEALEPEELAVLDRAIDRLLERARQLERQG